MRTVGNMIQDMMSAFTVFVFAAGWIDFGQGHDLTWWALIQAMGG